MSKFEQDAYLADQTKWGDIRNTRALLLKEADNMVNKALDKSEDASLYRQYRQELRDVPQSAGNPDDVVWPDKPTT